MFDYYETEQAICYKKNRRESIINSGSHIFLFSILKCEFVDPISLLFSILKREEKEKKIKVVHVIDFLINNKLSVFQNSKIISSYSKILTFFSFYFSLFSFIYKKNIANIL